MPAVITSIAGSGVQGDDAIAYTEFGEPAARFYDNACEFVSEGDGRLQHSGMIAATVDFQVRATGQSSSNANDNFTGTGRGYGHLLDTEIFFPVEHSGRHVVRHIFSIYSYSAELKHSSTCLSEWIVLRLPPLLLPAGNSAR